MSALKNHKKNKFITEKSEKSNKEKRHLLTNKKNSIQTNVPIKNH